MRQRDGGRERAERGRGYSNSSVNLVVPKLLFLMFHLFGLLMVLFKFKTIGLLQVREEGRRRDERRESRGRRMML